jgi:glycosyltransferase involved in cell wall biosynthesis
MRNASPPRLRVALVVASLRILGGQAVQAMRMLNGWRDDPEVEAWIVPVNPIPPAPFDRFLRVKYARTIITQLCYWPLLIRELRHADVVHVFSASYSSFLLAPLPAILVARLLGKPVLLNYHSGEAPDHLNRSWIARATLRHAVELNVVPSVFLQDVFARFGIPAGIVPNTIDRRDFPSRVRDLRRRPVRLLSTRNFEPLYNVACTLRAYALVQARFPDTSLTLVGSGSQESELRQLAADLQLRHVTFTGRVAPDEIARCYESADIYVQTPAVDNMPLSVLEAFSSGLPVVSTDVGGVSAVLTPGTHGLLARENDPHAVASRIVELIEQPDAARQFAVAAHEACAQYEWRHVRDSWMAAYRHVLSAGRRPRTSTEFQESM